MAARRNQGFTLIEMMIVVAILAIVATIAYPSYANHVLRAHRADGKEYLTRIAAAQERYYTNFNRYAPLNTLGFNALSENQYYAVRIVLANDDQTYTLTAAPQGAQTKDQCGSLTLTNTGFKDWTGDKPPKNGACW